LAANLLFNLLNEKKQAKHDEPAESEIKITKMPFYGMGKSSIISPPNIKNEMAAR
jgi:hypothetical protein